MSQTDWFQRENEPFVAHTPLRVGGSAKNWVWVYTESGLKEIISQLKKTNESWMIHWPFQDILCKEGGYPGTVIRLAGDFARIHYHNDSVQLGSAALWSQLDTGYERVFGLWSGSVGGLFSQKEEHLLSTYQLKIKWLWGQKIIEETIPPKGTSKWNKKKSILLSIQIFGDPRKRKFRPTPTGMIYCTHSKTDITDLFRKHQLPGIRLKDWLLCSQQPGRIIQLGTGNSRELLIFSQGIRERVQKIGGKKISLRIPLIGKEN